jgi:recombination protein RecR
MGIAQGDDMRASGSDGRALQRLLDELGRLPGIGPKSAQRIAYYILESDAEQARRLSTAILDVKKQVHFGPICFSYETGETCDVCADHRRDRTTICVVSEPRDVSAVERTGSHHGLYHVLGGVISPMDRIGPEQLHVKELLGRLASGEVEEVILATNTDVEGEATATYLSRIIKPLGVRVTRFAVGMSVGGEVELADELSLGRAIEDRREI